MLYNVKIRKSTDESVERLTDWRYTLSGAGGETISESTSFLHEINYFRSKNDNGGGMMFDDHIRIFSIWIHELVSWIADDTFEKDIQKHAGDLFAYHLIVLSKEELELEKTFGTIRLLQGKNFTFQNITFYNEKRVRGKAFLERALRFSSVVKSNYYSLMNKMDALTLLQDIESKRQYISSNRFINSSMNGSIYWFDLMTKYSNLISQLEINDANRIQSNCDEIIQSNVMWLIIRFLLVCFALVAVPFTIISLVKVQNNLYKYAQSLHHKVGLEQSRTEFLMRENSRHVEG